MQVMQFEWAVIDFGARWVIYAVKFPLCTSQSELLYVLCTYVDKIKSRENIPRHIQPKSRVIGGVFSED